jgi:hypothetical protein
LLPLAAFNKRSRVSFVLHAPLTGALHLIKGGSSKWIKDEFSATRGFAWQGGYADGIF